jgi:hypothetical protein|tara:strand:- start:62 stop:298 length:237 start_codon:yes stop_codon:yes gene_type:complete
MSKYEAHKFAAGTYIIKDSNGKTVSGEVTREQVYDALDNLEVLITGYQKPKPKAKKPKKEKKKELEKNDEREDGPLDD